MRGCWRDREFWFDDRAADLVVSFIETCLVHIKGEWADLPVILEPWQRDALRAIFGWKRADGLRRFRTVFIFVPRKNGKTTLAVCIALVMLFLEGEPSGEIYSAAADKPQAAIAFDIASQMVLRNPELERQAKVFVRHMKRPADDTIYRVLSSDAKTKHGFNASCVVADEIHAWPNPELHDVLETSRAGRRQPLVIDITTAGFDKESFCYTQYKRAKEIRDGIIEDDTWLPIIFEAEEGDDWKLKRTWRKANPNYGISPKEDYFKEEFQKALELPHAENKFKRLHLNIWTEQAVRWIPREVWDKCKADFTEEELFGKKCFGGLDLAGTQDLTALALAFPWLEYDDKVFCRVIWRFWIPEENIAGRVKRDRVDYDKWVRRGLIHTTPGNVADYDFIRNDIGNLADQFEITEIAYDPWNAQSVAPKLEGDGFTMVAHRQGFASMSPPTKEWERLVLGKMLQHNGNPVAAWMNGNVTIETDAHENIKPSKKKSTEKIDGIPAGIMAVGRAALHDADDGKSVYDSEELLVL